MRIFTISFFLIALNISVCGQSNPGKFSFGGHFGISSLAMNDLNTYVEKNYNDAGFDLNSIKYCLNTGIQVNYQLADRYGLRLGFGYYFPTKQTSSKPFYILDIQGEVMAKTTLNIDMATRGYNLYFGPVYSFLQSDQYQVLAGMGVLYSTGYLEMDVLNNDFDYSENQKWKNNSFGLMANANFEYFLNPFLSIFGGIEFRLMNISDLKDEDGETVIISAEVLSNKTISLDYSGVGLNAGILIYPFNQKK